MKESRLLEKLKAGKRVFGTWSMTGSATVVEVIGITGLDFVILDMEHGSMSFETVENLVRAAECTNCQPIVRVADAGEATILRALETGSQGIMVPHISTAEEARRIVSACRYAPEGSRGLSPYTRSHGYSHENIAESLQKNNENTFVGILVEGEEGIRNIESIADVQGLDLIYTGIYDISQSIGLSGQLNHPKVMEIQKKCVRAVKEKGVAAGSFARDKDYMEILMENGYDFIAYSADAFVLKHAYALTMKEIRHEI